MGKFGLLAIILSVSGPFSNAPMPERRYELDQLSEAQFISLRLGAWQYCVDRPVATEDPLHCMKVQDQHITNANAHLATIQRWFDYEEEPVETASCFALYDERGNRDVAPLEICLKAKADPLREAHEVAPQPAPPSRSQSRPSFDPEGFCEEVAGGSYYIFDLCMQQEMAAKRRQKIK